MGQLFSPVLCSLAAPELCYFLWCLISLETPLASTGVAQCSLCLSGYSELLLVHHTYMLSQFSPESPAEFSLNIQLQNEFYEPYYGYESAFIGEGCARENLAVKVSQ